MSQWALGRAVLLFTSACICWSVTEVLKVWPPSSSVRGDLGIGNTGVGLALCSQPFKGFWCEFVGTPCCLVAQLCPTLCGPMNYNTPGFHVLHYLLEFAQTHVHWGDDAIQPPYLFLPPSPPALNLSSIRVFSNELAPCIKWPKYWSFSFTLQWLFRVDFL